MFQVIILASTWAASSLPLLYNAYLCQHSCFGQSWSQHFCHVSQWQQYHKPLQLLPQFLIQKIRKIISTLNWITSQKHGYIKIVVQHTECSKVYVSSSSNQSYACLPSPVFLPSVMWQKTSLSSLILQKKTNWPSWIKEKREVTLSLLYKWKPLLKSSCSSCKKKQYSCCG